MAAKKNKNLLGTGIVILVGIIVALIAANLLDNSVTRTADLPRISSAQAFEQSEDTYFVYFWREDCPNCTAFEPYVVEAFNAGVPIYVVDMSIAANQFVSMFHTDNSTDIVPIIPGVSHFLPEHIQIEGTPTVIRIDNGFITEQGAGVPQARRLLDNYR